MQQKRVLIIEGSPRRNGNSQLLCEAFKNGAESVHHHVDLIRIQDKNINYCLACDACMRNNGTCIQKDDMAEILNLYQKADVLVLATPVYFYGVSAQMKTFIDRTYPIWQNLGEKDIYYIVSAGLGEDIISRSLGDLDGFVEHLTKYAIKGRLYASNMMEAGKVKDSQLIEEAYQMGKHI